MINAPLHFLNSDYEVDTESFFSSILLVEPDQEFAAWLTSALEDIVGEISHAASGQEALDLIETSLFELVILNVSLPDISGINLLHSVQHYRPGLPVVVTTNSGSVDEALQTMREGSWDCLVTTEDPEIFKKRVAQSIKHVAERKLKEMQDVGLRVERDAFYVAAQTAQDGLAVVGNTGIVSFRNGAFEEFCFCLGEIHTSRTPVNIITLISDHDQAVAERLRTELRGRSSGDSLWSCELKIEPGNADEDRLPRCYELTLTSVGVGGFEDLGLGMMPEFQRHIIWTRDITQRKQREKFQRELISTTSHDLKGPLSAIACAAEFINDVDETLCEDTLKLVRRIYSCARKAIIQVEEFLSARKIQDGVLVVQPTWQDADEILSDVVLEHSMMASTKEHQLNYSIAQEGLRLFADRLALHRVLGNLVSNAIKYTPDGGKIEITAEQMGNTVQISVSDNGPGIEASARHKLFECYGRLKEHREIEGTGLGLYIANNIVKAHSGHIDVKSQVGVGTTFVICLPNEVVNPTSIVENAHADSEPGDKLD